jgi:ribosomal protein L11
MRKVSLEMNLGKKSQARFPRRIQSNLKLKILAPACEAKPLPPLGPALTIFGVDARSFCEDFNHMSKDYDTGFSVSLNIWITQTKSYYYSFRSPSCFNLFHKCFDFYEGNDLNLKSKLLLLCCMNIALIKNVENQSVFMDKFIQNLKQILGSLRSYGFLQKKTKTNINHNIFLRKKDFIKNTKFSKKKK